MSNVISLSEVRSYATLDNLMKGLKKLGLDEYTGGEQIPLRYVTCKTPDNRWTAVFLVSEFFNVNKTGGYVGIASQHGFMSV